MTTSSISHESAKPVPVETITFTRFDLSQRIQHIILITSFTMLALTGIPQSFAQQGWARAFLGVLGGLDGARKIHHLFAVLLGFVFLYHVVNVIVDAIFKPSRTMLPRFQDVKDALQEAQYLLGRDIERPLYDKFDFRQKLEYWALIWGTILMALTGVILMFPQAFTAFLPGEVVYAARAAHGMEAVLAIASIITWHMYNTHFAGGRFKVDTTIFTGKISRERMMEEHPLEYERLIEEYPELFEDAAAEGEATDE